MKKEKPPSLHIQHMLQLHHHRDHHKTMQQQPGTIKPVLLQERNQHYKRRRILINDHIDILIEILKRLDGRSLCVAACVCRLWCTLARNDTLWEELCFRHVSSPPPPTVRPVVVALGGYKRLYMVCLRPVLSRLTSSRRVVSNRTWTRDELQLSLSLFCIDYYERLGVGERLGECDSSTSSLMFLCKPVNV